MTTLAEIPGFAFSRSTIIYREAACNNTCIQVLNNNTKAKMGCHYLTIDNFFCWKLKIATIFLAIYVIVSSSIFLQLNYIDKCKFIIAHLLFTLLDYLYFTLLLVCTKTCL